MYHWRGLAEIPSEWDECVATIGVFDGVHRGHQRVMARADEIARSRNLPVVVITFDPHPDEVVRPGPGSHPPSLTTSRRRAELLSGLGAYAMCVLPFTLEFSRLSPDEFVRGTLTERLHVATVVVGENFRFGHRALGDVPLLAHLTEKYHFTTEAVPLLAMDGVTISSSYIRERVAVGDVDSAARALGRPHRVEGVVVRGHMRGRRLGFPTANLETLPHSATPDDGVYAGWLSSPSLEGAEVSRWPAAISVSTNPTLGGGDRTVEAHAIDRNDLDLYGIHVAADFAVKLRGTRKFDSVDALVNQIRKDVIQARDLTVGLLASMRLVERIGRAAKLSRPRGRPAAIRKAGLAAAVQAGLGRPAGRRPGAAHAAEHDDRPAARMVLHHRVLCLRDEQRRDKVQLDDPDVQPRGTQRPPYGEPPTLLTTTSTRPNTPSRLRSAAARGPGPGRRRG